MFQTESVGCPESLSPPELASESGGFSFPLPTFKTGVEIGVGSKTNPQQGNHCVWLWFVSDLLQTSFFSLPSFLLKGAAMHQPKPPPPSSSSLSCYYILHFFLSVLPANEGMGRSFVLAAFYVIMLLH